MKESKAAIVNAIAQKAEGMRIVSLHQVASEMGHKHISSQDCRDIMNAVLKRIPDYKAVKIVAPGQPEATASLWTTLHFVEKNFDFDNN